MIIEKSSKISKTKIKTCFINANSQENFEELLKIIVIEKIKNYEPVVERSSQ